jgi:hypothetical protein
MLKNTVARGLSNVAFDALGLELPVSAVTFAISLPLYILCLYLWRHEADADDPTFDLMFSISIVATVLISYHLYAHDLFPVIIPLILLFRYISRGLVSDWVVSGVFFSLLPSSSVSGLTQVIALVFFKHTRMGVVAETLRFGIPTLVGLCWAVWKFLKSRNKIESHLEMVHASFLALALSWFAWYEVFSLGWPRYFLPPSLLSSMFVAAMLYQWTNKFSVAYTVGRSTRLLKTFRVDQRSLTALLAIIIVTMSLGRTLTILY